MQSIKIAVLGGGFQGTHIAYWFASRDFTTFIYEISGPQRRKIAEEMSKHRKRRILKKYLHVTDDLAMLGDCGLFIENIHEDLEKKRMLFRDVSCVCKPTAILASNSSTFPPGLISKMLGQKQGFINIHFLGIPFGETTIELIPGKETSPGTVTETADLLRSAGFSPVLTSDAPGFVYNRIKLVELANIFRAVEMDLVSIDTALAYLLFPKASVPIAIIDYLGLDVELKSLKYLNSCYGDRFYIPRILEKKIDRNELGYKTGIGLTGRSLDSAESVPSLNKWQPREKVSAPCRLNNIYISDLAVGCTNLLILLLQKGKNVFFPSREVPFWVLLRKINPKLYNRLTGQCSFISLESLAAGDAVDLIIDSPPVEMPSSVISQRVMAMQEQVSPDIPLLLHLPIHSLSEIAADTLRASMVFGMNCMRSYIANAELIAAGAGDPESFQAVRSLLIEVTGNCLVVADGYVRPLILSQAAKMLELFQLLEEKAALKEDLESLLATDSVFKDIDYLGIDTLLFITQYLIDKYNLPFIIPGLLIDMVKDKHYGIKSGQGLNTYYDV